MSQTLVPMATCSCTGKMHPIPGSLSALKPKYTPQCLILMQTGSFHPVCSAVPDIYFIKTKIIYILYI